MNKTMYEVNYHYTSCGNVLQSVSVSPITITRSFQGSISDYYDTEKEAYDSVREGLLQAIDFAQDTIARKYTEIETAHNIMESLPL